jgi:transcriptional regulator with XRE-family HTH domain
MKNPKIANEFVVLLGENIRKQRLARRFSQEAFADYIEFDRSNYGAIERGLRNISVFTLVKIAEGLDVEISELLQQTIEAQRNFLFFSIMSPKIFKRPVTFLIEKCCSP